ncbi:ATP-dependent Lon-type protease [Pseudomonas aeruginosa PA38182]|nr:ATP-dependent Lon-type protease [Pseudomonas aeruginosa PA38182]
MSQLDDKINQHFAGLVVRKDLVKAVKGNAIVPSYVLEYLLGQYCATNDESTIQTGIETVKEILRKHYVHRNEAGLVRSTIKEKGRHKVIDRISVSLNDKDDVYEAEFANLGIKKVLIDSSTVKAHQKLLVGGVWCIADLEYDYTEDKSASPWVLASLKLSRSLVLISTAIWSLASSSPRTSGLICLSRASASIRRCSASATSSCS